MAIAQLLCPWHERDMYDSDKESYCCNMQNGIQSITHHKWPSFFYLEIEYNPNREEKGLLRTPLLVSVSLSFIYTHMTNLSSVLSTYIWQTAQVYGQIIPQENCVYRSPGVTDCPAYLTFSFLFHFSFHFHPWLQAALPIAYILIYGLFSRFPETSICFCMLPSCSMAFYDLLPSSGSFCLYLYIDCTL